MSDRVPIGRVLARVSPQPTSSDFRVALESVESWTGALTDSAEAVGTAVGSGNAFGPGSILFGKLRPYLAKVWVADRHGAFYGDFIQLRPKSDGDPRYFGYVLRTPAVISPATSEATGSKMPRTEWDRLRQLEIASPPEADIQRQIAGYLDHETAEIDAFIADLEQLGSLERERLKAAIDQNVTKGLESDASFTESGHAAIGAYPAHWRLVRLKNVADTLIGLTYDPADIVDERQGGALVMRAGNIQDGQIVSNDDVYVRSEVPARLRLLAGDILVCARNGSASLVGKNAIVPLEYAGETFGAFMAVVRSRMNPFLRWFLSGAQFRVQAGSFSTSTINQLTAGTLKNMVIAVPPIEEQQHISDHLSRIDAIARATLADIDAAIALAKERRAALITAAVTGQIDVTTRQQPVVDSIQTAIEEAR